MDFDLAPTVRNVYHPHYKAAIVQPLNSHKNIASIFGGVKVIDIEDKYRMKTGHAHSRATDQN